MECCQYGDQSDFSECYQGMSYSIQMCECNNNTNASLINCLHLGPPTVQTQPCTITLEIEEAELHPESELASNETANQPEIINEPEPANQPEIINEPEPANQPEIINEPEPTSSPTNETEEPTTASCCSWSGWEEWSTCTKNCNSGSHSRTRVCNCGPQGEGIAEQYFPNYACGDDSEAMESGTCNNQSCCDYGDWTPWSSCTRNCGGGYQYRYHTCYCEEEMDTSSPSSGQKNGYNKRSVQAGENDDDHSSGGNSKSGNNEQNCYHGQTFRAQRSCNTAACSDTSTSNKNNKNSKNNKSYGY